MIVRIVLAVSVLASVACGSKEAEEICTKAADRYEVCIGEMLGEDAKKEVAGKRDLGACTGDKATVEMYRACLPKADSCDAFMSCIDEYVASH